MSSVQNLCWSMISSVILLPFISRGLVHNPIEEYLLKKRKNNKYTEMRFRDFVNPLLKQMVSGTPTGHAGDVAGDFACELVIPDGNIVVYSGKQWESMVVSMGILNDGSFMGFNGIYPTW